MKRAPQPRQQASVNHRDLVDVQTPDSAVATRRRGRPPVVDVTLTHEVAAWLEANLPRGTELVHTRRMGWMLRQWDSWESPVSGPRDGWREIESASDGQLGALLVRYLTAAGPRARTEPRQH